MNINWSRCTWRNGRVAVHELGGEGNAECGDQHDHQDGADGAETRWGLVAATVVRHVELGWAGLLLPSWELIVNIIRACKSPSRLCARHSGTEEQWGDAQA